MNLRTAPWWVFLGIGCVVGCGGEEFGSADPDAGSGGSTGGSSSSAVTTTGMTHGVGGGSSLVATMGTGGNTVATTSTGSGGSSGAGGVSGTGGSSTGGARQDGGKAGGGQGGGGGASVDGGAMCPATQPLSGSACASEGLSCRYGDCCPTTATCSGGKWLIAVPPCAPPVCPMQLPVNGSSCACLGGLSCHYDTCSQTQLESDARCINNAWSVQTYPCDNACGVQDCMAGQICLVKNGMVGCVANPCLPQPLACSCATSLCPLTNCSVMSAKLTCQ
jgi:hypothetical protein